MALVVVDAAPFFLVKPKLTIGDPLVDGVQFECAANQVEAAPEQDSNDTETFCGVFTSYKPAKWTVTITALQSFGTDGLWNNLRPLVGTVQPFAILPDGSRAAAADNVEMSGTAYLPEFTYLSAAVGEASEFDLVLAVQGVPTFDEAGVFTASADTGSE